MLCFNVCGVGVRRYYDDRNTLGDPKYMKSVSQLSYYELATPKPAIHRKAFTYQPGCFIKGSDDGGVYKNKLTYEACAQVGRAWPPLSFIYLTPAHRHTTWNKCSDCPVECVVVHTSIRRYQLTWMW